MVVSCKYMSYILMCLSNLTTSDWRIFQYFEFRLCKNFWGKQKRLKKTMPIPGIELGFLRPQRSVLTTILDRLFLKRWKICILKSISRYCLSVHMTYTSCCTIQVINFNLYVIEEDVSLLVIYEFSL